MYSVVIVISFYVALTHVPLTIFEMYRFLSIKFMLQYSNWQWYVSMTYSESVGMFLRIYVWIIRIK